VSATDFDTVADVLAGRKTGQQVRLRGWVHRQRSGGKLAFVVMRDGSGGVVQCTVKTGVADDDSVKAALRAKLEASVEELRGMVVADERAPGGFEVKVTKFQLHEPLGPTGDFPLRGEQGTEFELDKRHLWLRSTELSAIFRIKHRLYKAIRDFFDAERFVEVDPSVITTNACEGGSTLFTFDYFGQTAYLSQSAQMYLEGMIFGLPKVFCITPSFRAEKSRTSKHLTEFHHLEAEYAWWDNEASMKFQERMVEHLAHTIAKECEADLKILGQDPARLLKVKAPFERLTYDQCAERLRQLGFQFPDGEDFGVPHEKALTEGRTSPMFITEWPAKIKAFYMAEKPGTARVLCADMMAPDGFGELIGGSQRSEDIPSMIGRLIRQFIHDAQERAAEIRKEKPVVKFAESMGLAVNELLKGRVLVIDMEGVHKATKGIPIKLEPLAALFQAAADGDRSQFDRLWDGPVGRILFEAVVTPYEWYFDLRRFGSVPHSGFGLGVERLLRWFTGQEHIRDMLPYPRTPARAYP
jgi:asparaginyl-tRNA synthetase